LHGSELRMRGGLVWGNGNARQGCAGW
jgi:hypothetical protein